MSNSWQTALYSLMMLNHANLQKNVILYNAGGGQTKGLSTLKGLLQDLFFRLGEAMTAMSFNICGIWGVVVVSSIRMEIAEGFGAPRVQCFNLDDIS